ncbi:hypothetical protein KHA80_21195 [Anaerobacillus sp. HL2]|nr:hypothetical protein KHA80_21195 [Anaerobacillus sp. HL2]
MVITVLAFISSIFMTYIQAADIAIADSNHRWKELGLSGIPAFLNKSV